MPKEGDTKTCPICGGTMIYSTGGGAFGTWLCQNIDCPSLRLR